MEPDSRTIAFLAIAAFMSLLLLCCIILSILFYIRYRDTATGKDGAANIEWQRIKKLKEKLMKQFKKDLKYQTSKAGRHGGKVVPSIHVDSNIDTSCSICLDSLAEGDPADTILTLIIKCGHVFHMGCVWPWLERDHTCPICRRDTKLSIDDLQAVTVYHILNNLDDPSIRESVSRADLQPRLACVDGLEVVSVNEDETKTTRTPRMVTPAPLTVHQLENANRSSLTEERYTNVGNVTIHVNITNSGENSSGNRYNLSEATAINGRSDHSSDQHNNDSVSHRESTSLGISRSTTSAFPVIFTIGGDQAREVSNV